MKKDAKEILSYNIVPNIGLGEIHFGMTKDTILQKYNFEVYLETNECTISGNRMEFYSLFNESVILGFDKEENFSLTSILLENEFKGKYLNAISIGTPFIELYKATKNKMTYDDDLFFPEGNYDFYVNLDYDECKEKLGYPYLSDYMVYNKDKEMRTCKIESFFFRKDI